MAGYRSTSLALGSLFLMVFASACGAAVTRKMVPSAVVSRQHEELDPALMQQIAGERDGDAYRVGPGDELLVAVYGHPELSIATYAGGTTSVGARATLTVDNDGTMQLPLIGSVKVAGKTQEQLRKFLETELAVYVRDPKVTVQVVLHATNRFYLLGQFVNPGVKFTDRPLRLLEGIGLGGSVVFAGASLRSAYVARNGKKLPINFRRLLREGDLSQNIPLRTGDVIMVPDAANEQVFVFAGAPNGAARGGPVPFRNGRLTIMQALATAGYGYRDRALAKLSKTRVIRSEGERAELFVIDASKILKGEAGDFELEPGDVVFVPARPFTTWNMALEQLIPTLQTVSGLLNPFVQIKYLQQSTK
ncbi:MAG TPA: polysaccharide biosynthesis/export family protein [Polyangiales bacterium]